MQYDTTQHIDFNPESYILHCTMLRSTKGGHMLIIAVGFLVGTVTLMVLSTADR